MAFGLTFKSKDDVTPSTEDVENLVQKSRRDILGLKVMLYTAVILLVGGFMYYNNKLETAHKNFHLEIEYALSHLDTEMQSRALGTGNRMEDIVEGMNNTISRLNNEPPEVQQLIERVKEDSGDFLYTYRQYKEDRVTRFREKYP